jgi:hypothetical protein
MRRSAASLYWGNEQHPSPIFKARTHLAKSAPGQGCKLPLGVFRFGTVKITLAPQQEFSTDTSHPAAAHYPPGGLHGRAASPEQESPGG